MKLRLIIFFVFIIPALAFIARPYSGFSQPMTGTKVSMQLTSTMFSQQQTIADQFTCKGQNISPYLSWSGAPGGTKSFALIVEDPDAQKGTFTHWVAYNIDPNKSSLPQDLPKEGPLDGIMQGKNDSGQTGYTGPCPPQGSAAHRYYFRIFALDSVLNLQPGASKIDVRNAMNGHILAEGDLMARYEIK